MCLSVLIVGLAILGVATIAALVYWFVRPNTSQVAEQLDAEFWVVVDDGWHNAFIDMVRWREHFYLTYRKAPTHLGFGSRVVVMRSPDARTWETLAELTVDGDDVRDPKLAIIHDRLFLYVLRNRGLFVRPCATLVATSIDGENWSAWREFQPAGWVFWRLTSRDEKEWHTVVSRKDHRLTALFRSQDGLNWSKISEVWDKEFHGEVGIAFTAPRELTGIVRIAGPTIASIVGGSTDSTGIIVTREPYHHWHFTRSDVARLDGSVLFWYGGALYAVARYEPEPTGLLRRGNLTARKRTSIYRVEKDALYYLTDLPSGGDTAYPGAVVMGDDLYLCYYSSDIRRDYPWFLGSVLPTAIRMAKIKLSSLPVPPGLKVGEVQPYDLESAPTLGAAESAPDHFTAQ